MESLSDKLRSLGVQLGASQLKPPRPPAEKYPIETVISGSEHTTVFGNTFVVENRFPAEYHHGTQALCDVCDLTLVADWAKAGPFASLSLEKILFMDTETSGLAGGTGTFAFLIGLGYATPNEFRLIQLFMRDPSLEPALLASLLEFVNGFEGMVTYNGKAFDVPLLNTRHVLHSIPLPFNGIAHVDLLHLARRIWKNRLPSRRLADLETEILNFSRSSEEIPGWMIPELYFDYLRSGDARPLEGVLYHNAMDILSLAGLFQYTSALLSNAQKWTDANSLDIMAIAKLYEDLGKIDQALDLYESCLQKGLPPSFFVDALQRYSLLYKRQNRWNDAEQLWLRAVEYHQLWAYIELAKYYEHHKVVISQAIEMTEAALRDVANSNLPTYRRRQLEVELAHRLERLKSKSPQPNSINQTPSGG